MDEGYVNDGHPAPRRQFVLVSAGEVEVTVSDGEVRRFGPGSVFLDDDTGKGHRTRAVGPGGCVVVWVACPWAGFIEPLGMPNGTPAASGKC